MLLENRLWMFATANVSAMRSFFSAVVYFNFFFAHQGFSNPVYIYIYIYIKDGKCDVCNPQVQHRLAALMSF